MIRIRQSPTADTRTCDFANVTQETLLASSVQHICDVRSALGFFRERIVAAEEMHDHDKISDIAGFHADFVTGFAQTGWWDRHRKLNRHHLTQDDGIPADVNLIDVLDFIADCVMAGMARSGSVWPLKLSPELLERAFQNTVDTLKSEVVVMAQCEACQGSGEEVVGEHHVSRDMAIDAGDLSMEGAFHSYATGPCDECSGSGWSEASPKADAAAGTAE